jgi:hypothetical protein
MNSFDTCVGFLAHIVIGVCRSARDTKANFYTSDSAVEPWNNKTMLFEVVMRDTLAFSQELYICIRISSFFFVHKFRQGLSFRFLLLIRVSHFCLVERTQACCVDNWPLKHAVGLRR